MNLRPPRLLPRRFTYGSLILKLREGPVSSLRDARPDGFDTGPAAETSQRTRKNRATSSLSPTLSILELHVK
jgi:hypothetical protein